MNKINLTWLTVKNVLVVSRLVIIIARTQQINWTEISLIFYLLLPLFHFIRKLNYSFILFRRLLIPSTTT